MSDTKQPAAPKQPVTQPGYRPEPQRPVEKPSTDHGTQPAVSPSTRRA